MADPTQQQSPQGQGGGILSSIGSGLEKALPYALPAVLGAALGGPAGALAGVGTGMADVAEAQNKQQELALRWQQMGLDIQQGQMAVSDKQAWERYASNLSPDEQAFARQDPNGFLQNKMEYGQWRMGLDSIKQDPDFAAKFKLDPTTVDALEKMGPKFGGPALSKIISQAGKFPGGVKGPTTDDGGKSWYFQGFNADGSITKIPTGVPSSFASAQLITAPQREAAQKLSVDKQAAKLAEDSWKALPMWATRGGLFGGLTHDQYVEQQTAKYKTQLQGSAAGGAASPASTAKPAAASASTGPPKSVWGKTVDIDGKRYSISPDGKTVTPASETGGPSASAGGGL